MQPVIEATPTKEQLNTNGHHPHDEPEIWPQDEYNQALIQTAHPPEWQNPTPTPMYNLVVIGAGSAGLVAAVGAAGLGGKVAVIERDLIGGDCLNAGCVPSKTVIRSAKILGELYKAESLGVHIPDGTAVDFGAVMARMRRIRAEISDHESADYYKSLGIDVFFGEGQFTSPSTISVDGQTLNFKKAVIATGGRAMHLPIPGLAEAGYITNQGVFQLTKLPKRLAVIGAGPIGAELTQSFRRFGSEVIVFDIVPRLLGREDQDAADLMKDVFEREGIRLALGASISQVEVGADGKTIHYELDGESASATVDEILLSAGRQPNLEDLNLEAANVEYHKKGVTVSETLQTTNPNVYAAGDVAFKYQFTHTADATARIVLQNALFPGPKKKVTDLIVPWSTYTDPEVAHVGLYDHEAEAQGIAVETFIQPIPDIDRGKTDGESQGFVKIHVKKGTDKILGATIVAKHAGEMISEITVAMVAGVGLKTLSNAIHPYPTQAEAIKKIADAYNRTRLTPTVKRIFSAWLAWTRR